MRSSTSTQGSTSDTTWHVPRVAPLHPLHTTRLYEHQRAYMAEQAPNRIYAHLRSARTAPHHTSVGDPPSRLSPTSGNTPNAAARSGPDQHATRANPQQPPVGEVRRLSANRCSPDLTQCEPPPAGRRTNTPPLTSGGAHSVRGQPAANITGSPLLAGAVGVRGAPRSLSVKARTQCPTCGGERRCAIAAASSRFGAPSLRRMCETWTLAVLTLTTSSAAISRLV